MGGTHLFPDLPAAEVASIEVELGALAERIYDDLLGGAPVRQAVDLIRARMSACLAVLTVEPRDRAAERLTVVSGEPDLIERYAGLVAAQPAASGRLTDDFHYVAFASAAMRGGTEHSLWLLRARTAPAFGERETAVCGLLLSHLRRALDLLRQRDATEAERRLYSTVMDRLSVGIILLDRRGAVLTRTGMAAAVLDARDGLQVVGGRLRADVAVEDKALQAVIKGALLNRAPDAGLHPHALAVTRASGGRNLGILVQALTAGDGCGPDGPTVAIFIRDPDSSADVQGEFLRQLFDLTPAEAAVARQLALGLSLDEAASTLHIRRNTARAHLRSIFSKSGITRQTDLIRLLLNSAAVLGPRVAA